MKFKFLISFFCFAFLHLNAQKLTLNNLENICNRSNWEDVNQLLMNKNWEYYESSKGDSEKYNTITWSFNKSYDDKASAWFYLYTYEGFPNKIRYSVFNKPSYTIIQKALSSKGYKLQNSEIEDNELVSTYANNKFLIEITTEKREKDSYSSFEESLTAYSFQLIRKSSVYDPDNGRKTNYYPNSDQLENEYTLKNGKFEGSYKGYYVNGALKTEGNYINDKKSGLWKEYDDQNNLTATYIMKNGELEGVAKIYEDNKLNRENSFSKNELNGISKNYFYGEDDNVMVVEKLSYQNGTRHGTDQFIYIDDEKNERVLSYTKYVEGLKNGQFQEFKGDSLILGNYKDDKLNGSYKLYRDLTKLLFGGVIETDTTKLQLTDIGQYQRGLKTGYWKHYEITGGLSEGNYSQDKKTGPWKFYYSKFMNGEQPEPYAQELYLIENYSNGKRNGTSEYFSKISYKTYKCNELDKNNKPKDSCSKRIYNKIHLLANYKDNELHGSYVMKDSLGKLRYKGNYNYGKENGEWMESYTIETELEPIYVYKKGNYESGIKEGKWIEYLNDEHVLVESNYKYNFLNGLYTRYNLDGIRKEEKIFRSNELKELKVYDSLGQNIEKIYKILSENRSAYKVRLINYFKEGGRLEADYYIVKPKEEVSHHDFKECFHKGIKTDGNSFQDGMVLLVNSDGSVSMKGYMYKTSKTGTWEYNYPKQNVKIVTKYVDNSNKPNSEIYYTLDTHQLFNGDFKYFDTETDDYEERRIRDGLRNGNTTYYNKTGDKLKREKYKDGLLKD